MRDNLHVVQQYLKVLEKFPEQMPALIDSVSDGQLSSKEWLGNNLACMNLGTIFLCGGWLGTLMHDQNLLFKQCISFDVDPSCKVPAEIIHRHLLMDGWKFLAFTKDIHDIDYSNQPLTVTRANGTTIDISVSPDTIINTSCEHIENFSAWWDILPAGKLIAVQSNNGFDIPGHVNCVASLEEFAKQTPMATVLYEGSKEMPKFMRYMRIGRK
jgi:hypothetical protein